MLLNNYCSAVLTIFKGLYQLIACVLETVKLLLHTISYICETYYDKIIKLLGWMIGAIAVVGAVIEVSYILVAIFG